MTSASAPPPATTTPRRGIGRTLLRWIDSHSFQVDPSDPRIDRLEWQRVAPLVVLHLACLLVLVVGWSPVAVLVAVALYVARMFAITGFYHRYFAHRTFRTSRPVAFLFAFLANSSAQRGPLWWAAHHRKHHKYSDQPRDAHSPHQRGFWWSHVLWFTTRRNYPTDLAQIPDFARHREILWLDRCDMAAPLVLALAMFGLGELLAVHAPSLGTDGWQMLVWGFLVSTVVLFHGTFTINSLGHLFGRRRYQTGDHSRNSFLLALLTLGEGWHNNHHFYPVSVRQGFFWWELDATYQVLRAMSWLGLVWDLRPVPDHVRNGERVRRREAA
ncbi:MAG: acyl-CoA desaturase [Planctomycetes bacterium]|nr:acyl-CoA desaturase [Planctomycetota bacterium]